MVKICFVTDDISQIGGIQRVTSVLVNELSQNSENEISILFTSPIDKAKLNVYKIEDTVNVYYTNYLYPKRYKYLINKMISKINTNIIKLSMQKLLIESYFPNKEILLYENFFKENPQDIIIGIGPKFSAKVSLLNLESKKIGWLHNTYKRYFEIPKKWLWNQEDIYKKLFNKLDELVVLSDFDKEEYDKYFDINSIRIYNPLSFMSEEKSKLNQNTLLFVGRILYETKGINLLLKIMSQIVKVKPNIILNIVGDGPDRNRMIDDIKSLKLENNILYHGGTSNVEDHYLNNSILLLPSTIEGFGLVVTEAMEYGLPVISFETEGPSEIIEDSVSGYLIPKFNIELFSEKILYLLSNPTRLKEMGESAAIRSNEFSSRNIVRQWEILFRNLINR
ncbi:glycosyltransferase [Aerococcus urinaeequi]|uniref:glycosyltransferase n=1 Tax=Aerococcus urinaeequi TaxID=51665 RepID=UPI003D6AA5B2